MDDFNSDKSNWTDSDWEHFERWLRDLLYDHRVRVTFRKSDGSLREMNCTLQGKIIQPLIEQKYGSAQSKTNRKAPNFTVWDLDVNDWRSFVLRRVESIQFAIE